MSCTFFSPRNASAIGFLGVCVDVMKGRYVNFLNEWVETLFCMAHGLNIMPKFLKITNKYSKNKLKRSICKNIRKSCWCILWVCSRWKAFEFGSIFFTDNFQEGKRRRILGSAYKRSPWVTPNKTPPDSSRLQKSRSQRKKSKEQSGKKEDCSVKKEEAAEGKNAAPDLSCVASSEAKLGRKRPGKHFLAEMNQMNPRATSTPTPKRIRGGPHCHWI